MRIEEEFRAELRGFERRVAAQGPSRYHQGVWRLAQARLASASEYRLKAWFTLGSEVLIS